MAEEKKKTGPPVVKAMSSNTLSDAYRDSLTISYSFIGTCVADTTFEIGGRKLETPIMAGPMAIPEKGENTDLEYGKAAMNAGSIWWDHYHNVENHRAMLKAGVPSIRVLKPLADIDRLIEEIRFDTENGAAGYSMDLSHAMTIYGELDAQAEQFGIKTREDMIRLNEASPLPFFVKDIMSVRDAVILKEIGVAGVVLSGHNNRFPCATPPLKLLPEVRKAVGDDFKIFIDGGITNGYDAFKALALGADGVLCARALSAKFFSEGPEGLTNKLCEMTAELKGAMGATCSPDLKHINRDCIIRM